MIKNWLWVLIPISVFLAPLDIGCTLPESFEMIRKDFQDCVIDKLDALPPHHGLRARMDQNVVITYNGHQIGAADFRKKKGMGPLGTDWYQHLDYNTIEYQTQIVASWHSQGYKVKFTFQRATELISNIDITEKDVEVPIYGIYSSQKDHHRGDHVQFYTSKFGKLS